MERSSRIQRMTRQRRLLLEVLRRPDWHPTADDLYAAVRSSAPHLSLGTVYRNLGVLADNNQVVRIDSEGAQQRYDGNVHPHFHAQCTCCGTIRDVFPAALSGPMPDPVYVPGFKITGLRLLWMGVCESCQDSGPDVRDLASG